MGHPLSVTRETWLAPIVPTWKSLSGKTGGAITTLSPRMRQDSALHLAVKNFFSKRRVGRAGAWAWTRGARRTRRFPGCEKVGGPFRDAEDTARRTFLDERLRHTAWLLLLLGRWDEAAELVRERKALRPGDPTVALGAAVQHAAAILVRHRDSLPLAIFFAWIVPGTPDSSDSSGDPTGTP
jgi:hypothetical protein